MDTKEIAKSIDLALSSLELPQDASDHFNKCIEAMPKSNVAETAFKALSRVEVMLETYPDENAWDVFKKNSNGLYGDVFIRELNLCHKHLIGRILVHIQKQISAISNAKSSLVTPSNSTAAITDSPVLKTLMSLIQLGCIKKVPPNKRNFSATDRIAIQQLDPRIQAVFGLDDRDTILEMSGKKGLYDVYCSLSQFWQRLYKYFQGIQNMPLDYKGVIPEAPRPPVHVTPEKREWFK